MCFECEIEVKYWFYVSGEFWRIWVVMDDQVWLFELFCRQLVVCDLKMGLMECEL